MDKVDTVTKAMNSTDGSATLECPYCGVQLDVIIPKDGFLSFSFQSKLPIVNINIGKKSILVVTSYNIECKFCNRKYTYYKFDNYNCVLSMLRFSDSALLWLKRYEIDIRDLGDMIVGVVEPKDRYQNFIRRLRSRFGKKVGIKYLEIVFKCTKGGREQRGVLVGKMTAGQSLVIDVEYGYWCIE